MPELQLRYEERAPEPAIPFHRCWGVATLFCSYLLIEIVAKSQFFSGKKWKLEYDFC
jgi:hypothetical protein